MPPATYILRLRTRDGTHRVSLPPSAPIDAVWSAAYELIGGIAEFSLFAPTGAPLQRSGPSIAECGLSHGDMLMVQYSAPSTVAPTAAAPTVTSTVTAAIDPIDAALAKLPGLIQRPRDPTFCRHGEKGMCDYCSPLEPYDATYLDSNKIKHMSYNAYMRKLGVTAAPGATPLDPPNSRVLVPCPSRSHAPWPASICSKCQPSAVTLARQTWRTVDHVEFETPDLVEQVIGSWRMSGAQRVALLLGQYAAYDGVPLGVKAVVRAVFEVAQHGAADGVVWVGVPGGESASHAGGPITASPEEAAEADHALKSALTAAAACGLVPVGWMVTDLADAGKGDGTVACKRHDASYFLTSLEVRLAAHLQRTFPHGNPRSPTGIFGSRFATVVVTGNKSGAIEPEAWQVSECAVALVDADLVEPSTVPGTMLVREAEPKVRYVPDIMYVARNEYGTNVSHRADQGKGFPVDYLLVNLTTGFPTAANATEPMFPGRTYPQAHRALVDPAHCQSESSLARFIHHHPTGGDQARVIPDFAFLQHVAALGILPADQFNELAAAFVHARGVGVTGTAAWMTLTALVPEPAEVQRTAAAAAVSSGDGGSGGVGSGSSAGPWTCRHCTFTNMTGADCEMCGLPRG
ncbi:NPL4 family-domain-containing protein [Blastocladiella britannica]|nr:NPL4 family-domain-containing protein [Blastocladiella britannica]